MTKAEVEALKVIEGCSNWSDIQHRILPRVTKICEERERLVEALRELRRVATVSSWAHIEFVDCNCKSCVIRKTDKLLATINQKGSGSE